MSWLRRWYSSGVIAHPLGRFVELGSSVTKKEAANTKTTRFQAAMDEIFLLGTGTFLLWSIEALKVGPGCVR